MEVSLGEDFGVMGSKRNAPEPSNPFRTAVFSEGEVGGTKVRILKHHQAGWRDAG